VQLTFITEEPVKPEIKSNYFPSLDGLRAISVLLVIFVHLKYKSSVLAHIPGWLGVDCFFVISGFLITTLLFREERKTGSIDVRAFYTRRFFRIIPIYALILAVYVLLCSLNADKWAEIKHALPYYLTFLNEFAADHTPFGTTWSLGVEEKFYLVWPLLFFVLLRGRNRWLGLLVLFAATTAMPFRMAHSYFGLLCGCSLAGVYSEESRWRSIKFVAGIPSIALILLISFVFSLVDLNLKWVFLFCGVVTILVAHLLSAKSWMEKLLSSVAFVWVGKRSYSMYLIHGLVLDVVQHFMAPANFGRQMFVTALSFTLCALGADVLFRFVEEPARRYGKAVLSRRLDRAIPLTVQVIDQPSEEMIQHGPISIN
jgi:peptidoglycan/LPS O-acetylase OafA/YrhL